jgi:glycosyltransferase involved in cell wall biosynthesis
MTARWLSILIPAFNVEPYVEECVESVLRQAQEIIEVIVLDDASRDGTWQRMLALEQRWQPYVRILRHASNQGVSAARNTLLGAAEGDYVWFLDADDKLCPGALTDLRAIVQHNAPDLILCDFSVWRERMRLKHLLRGEGHRATFLGSANRLVRDPAALLVGLLQAGQLHMWSKVAKRSLWTEDLRFPVGQVFEDVLISALLALRARNFYYCPKPWVMYRQRRGSILASMNLSKAIDQSRALVPLRAELEHWPYLGDARVRLALAHQCGRNLTGAMRYLHKHKAQLPPQMSARALADRFRQDFRAASPWSARELARAYLRRGWWLRWIKFCRWYGWQP